MSSKFSSIAASEMVVLLCQRARRAPESRLQISVHEVDLLQTAKSLADVLRAHVPHSLDCLQLCVAGGKDLVQPAELPHDRLDDELRQPRDTSEYAVAARGHGVVEGVELPVVAEKLGKSSEVQNVLVRQPRERVEDHG